MDERVRNALESIVHAVLVLDCDGRIIFANKSAESILGCSRDAMVGRMFRDGTSHVTTLDGYPNPLEDHPFLKALSTQRPVYGMELAVKRPDGTKAILLINVGPFREKKDVAAGVIMSFSNIARRKAAESLLAESERRFRDLLQRVQLFAVILDIEGNITFVNDYLLAVTGWQWGEVIMRNFFDLFIPPERREKVEQAFINSIILNEAPASIENEIATRDGSLRTISLSHVLLYDPDGNIMGLASIGQDVTEQRKAEEELRKSEAKYRMLVEQIPAVTYIESLDEARVKHYISPQLNKLLGYTQEEFMREPGLWRRYIHPEDYENVSAAIANVCITGGSLSLEYRLFASDGHVKWFRDQAVMVRSESGEPLFLQGIMLDITESKKGIIVDERVGN